MLLSQGTVKPQTTLDSKLSDLRGVGPHVESALQRIGLMSYRDVLMHFPIRYEDRTRILSIKDVRPETKALIQGQIIQCQLHMGRRRWLELTVEDKTSSLSLVLFHFSPKQKAVFEKKPLIRCYGEIKQKGLQRSMVHPEFTFIQNEDDPVDECLTPVYPTTQGLHQNILRKIIDQGLALFEKTPVLEILPSKVLEAWALPCFKEAIREIHKPSPESAIADLLEKKHPAFKRLIVEELLAHQTHLKLSRLKHATESSCPLLQDNLIEPFMKRLPFELTNAQKRTWEEIKADLTLNSPMIRLVQGDVGSGKTVIAALASLIALSEGKQVALMAPTEILAEQHYQQFQAWLEPLQIPVMFLSGKSKVSVRKKQLEILQSLGPLMVVGTHALFQESVVFHDLALIVVDEQHRFGVHQRMLLRSKGQKFVPHQLIMTATPIPRSLAMTQFSDLDLSVIDELPPNRKPVTTLCICQSKREEVIVKIKELCAKGQQIYWVCPLITESDKLQIQAAEATYQLLQEALPNLQSACVHGKMKSSEKESIMHAFKEGHTQILVATTVIEVGVNVPNATLMVIENPERLGLAQLHQLRGRVGRGADASFCILLFKSPLSYFAQKRLQIMRETQDGFLIAEMDLQIRGPGEVLGVRQTGGQTFKIVDLLRDQTLIKKVNQWVKALPQEKISSLASKLSERWFRFQQEYVKV